MIAGVADAHPVSQDLPALAMSRPSTARAEAETLLTQDVSALDHSYALQALGIVAREEGDTRHAIAYFRRGVVLSDEAELAERSADLAASLGTALAMAGRKHDSLEAFRRALLVRERVGKARALVRRAAARILFGDLDEAYLDARRAALILHKAGDRLWEARARNNAAHALLQLGRFTEADHQYLLAEALVRDEGQHYDATTILHSRGDCAHRQGDLPKALRMLHQAKERYRELGVVPPEIVRDLAVVSLAAGLTDEAVAAADELVDVLESDPMSAGRRAEGLAAAATAHLDHGNPSRAIELARRSVRASHRQGNVQGEWHARLVLLRAQASTGRITKHHAHLAAHLAVEIQERYAAEQLEARLLAGHLARRTGLIDLAEEEFAAAASQRHRGSALRRAGAWLAAAQLADIHGDRAAMLRACERGLAVLDTHALSLGATELRARATMHGIELFRTAIGRVLDDGSARDLLRWAERGRSILHAAPTRQARRDRTLTAELAKLRESAGDIAAPVDASREATRRRVEERIRRLTHESTHDDGGHRQTFDIRELLAALGEDMTLACVVVVRSKLYVVVAQRGRVRRFAGGAIADARSDVEFARFALRGAAVRSPPEADAMLAALEPALARLEQTVLGPQALRAIGDGPLVLMPPATLQSAPWAACLLSVTAR